jgi:hypothetical protein
MVFLGTLFRGAAGLTQTMLINAVEAVYKDSVEGEILRI